MDYENLYADVDCILDKHYSEGRYGSSIEFIVVHYNAANLTTEGCYSVWQTRQASAHYQVEESGRVGQLVWDRNTAWHASNWNANTKSIGIEHANRSDGTISDACLDAGAHLVAALCKRYGLGRPEWNVNVFPHNHFAATSCPGEIDGSQNAAYMSAAQHWYDVMTGAVTPTPSPEATTTDPQVPGDAVNDSNFTYRAHVADYGWLPAVRDGQVAGTVGLGKRLEAIKIAPPEGLVLNVRIHIQDKGWITYPGIKAGESSGEGSSANDPIIGTVGESLRAEAILVDVESNTTGKHLRYQVHVADYGWTGWVPEDTATGSVGMGKAIEAIQFVLE